MSIMSLATFALIALAILSMSLKVLPEYERGVVFRLGRVLTEAKGPGIILLIPFVDKIIRISTRTVTLDIEPQDVISRDNVTMKVNAVLYLRVVDPNKAVINVENYLYATSQLAQTHLRSTLGENTLDELLTARERINSKLQGILDENTDPWGIKVVSVEVKHIDLPSDMQRAMAREAESERERRAKVIAADGELQAASKMRQAADEMSGNPVSVQLRYLQTLQDLSTERGTIVVFPLPIDMFKKFTNS